MRFPQNPESYSQNKIVTSEIISIENHDKRALLFWFILQ